MNLTAMTTSNPSPRPVEAQRGSENESPRDGGITPEPAEPAESSQISREATRPPAASSGPNFNISFGDINLGTSNSTTPGRSRNTTAPRRTRARAEDHPVSSSSAARRSRP